MNDSKMLPWIHFFIAWERSSSLTDAVAVWLQFLRGSSYYNIEYDARFSDSFG
jgi:hypothetical protein